MAPRPPGRARRGAQAVGPGGGRGGAARAVPSPSCRSPPPVRSGAPRRWARPAADKVSGRRGDARARLQGAERRRARLGSARPDRGAGLGQAPVRRRRSGGGGGGAGFSSPAGFPLWSIPVGARERSPAGPGRSGIWSRGAGPALAPRSRRPRGRGGLGRQAAAAAPAAGAPPPGCWTGTAGCCATALSTWRSTRRCPSPNPAKGPAPASRAAVSIRPASATRAGWATSASTARAGSSKCLRRTPNLSLAPQRRGLPPTPVPSWSGVPGLGAAPSAAFLRAPRLGDTDPAPSARHRPPWTRSHSWWSTCPLPVFFPDRQKFLTQLRCQTPFC